MVGGASIVTLSQEAQHWIEQQAGGRIVAVERQARWREQHFVTVEKEGETVDLLVRFGRDPEMTKGSRLLTRRDIEHEGRVLEVLQGHGLRVPTFLGYNADERFILMERLPGENRLAEAPDDATRRQVMFEYYEQLAALHGLDVESMHVVGIDIPTTPEEIAFDGKFSFASDDYRDRRAELRPEPLLDLGVWWLHANVPQGDRPVTFVQGDTGPGQFMFDDGHLTGLIDWELAHIADPMLDLGVAWMRNMLYPAGSLREPIEHYDDVTGGALDWQVLGFYTVLSMLFTPLGVVDSLQKPSARLNDLLPRYEWDITLRRGLCDALAEVLDIELEAPDLPEPHDDAPTMADLLGDHLGVNVLPIARDAGERYQVDMAVALSHALRLESRIGAQLLADDLDDMGMKLGRRPTNRAEGLAALSRLVEEHPEENLHDLVRLFSRIERRREHLWRPMMLDSASVEFERLIPRDARGW
jgi:aminoglycoside phosphotransferase (APT) family kinase protein